MISYLQIFPNLLDNVEDMTKDEVYDMVIAVRDYAFRDIEPDFSNHDRFVRYLWKTMKENIDYCANKVKTNTANSRKRLEKTDNDPDQIEDASTSIDGTSTDIDHASKKIDTTSKRIDRTSKSIDKVSTSIEGTSTKIETAYIKEQDKEQDKDKDNIERETKATPPKPKRERFVPPSASDVLAYCKEKGIPFQPVDAQRFVDFYASKGWMVGSNHMSDWKAAVRNWANRAYSPGAPVPVQQARPVKTVVEQQYDQRQNEEHSGSDRPAFLDKYKDLLPPN